MPFLTPKKSGVHRTACFALYRALLQESSRVTGVQLPFLRSALNSRKGDRANDQNEASMIFDALRRQFRASTQLQGHQIVGALQMGYEALHHLRSASSPFNPSALSQLAQDLRCLFPPAPPASKPALTPSTSEPLIEPSGTTPSGRPNAGPRVWRHPLTSPVQPHILQRPLPRSALSGRRHVPRLVVTSGIAFLRIKKPQPAYLSRIIRDKRERRQKHIDLIEALESWHVPLAEAEDAWERRVHADDKGNVDEPTFAAPLKRLSKQLVREGYEAMMRDRRWGERLWAIAQKERQLKFEEEGVLEPIRGCSPERRRIMARERRERRERNHARKAAEGGAVEALSRRKKDTDEEGAFVVRLEGSRGGK